MKPLFYERVRQTLRTLQIPIPNTYSNFIEIPPPWTLSIPQSDTSLNIFRKNDIPYSLIKNTFINKLTKFSKSYHIYTDASKISTGVGAAVITPNITLEYKLPCLSCIHTDELYAIYQALVHINSSNISNALIITDSLSSINTINQLYTKHPIALLIKKELATIQNNNYTVQFLWGPSHIGLQGNEEADRTSEAQQARNSETASKVRDVVLNDLKSFIKVKVENLWQNQWDSSTSKLCEVKTFVKPWKSKIHQVIVTRLRLGHTRLTHGHIIGHTNPTLCENCNIPLSVKHVLVECPRYQLQRQNNHIIGLTNELLGENCKIEHLVKFF
ncbi:uncharacterized protein [Diabrotica undecimpunctata]|uniref:uncharacterized protein n=1 Tax=Diabrotica undecimpunctata TaxID=50387 RepID=UPI003B6334D7